jgi:hypothetical protein
MQRTWFKVKEDFTFLHFFSILKKFTVIYFCVQNLKFKQKPKLYIGLWEHKHDRAEIELSFRKLDPAKFFGHFHILLIFWKIQLSGWVKMLWQKLHHLKKWPIFMFTNRQKELPIRTYLNRGTSSTLLPWLKRLLWREIAYNISRAPMGYFLQLGNVVHRSLLHFIFSQ